jgi:hypothetical protein
MLKTFTFGDKAIDYLQARIWKDGDTISALLLAVVGEFESVN